jgi:type IV pilus secretin PilQ/predicted competence protein
MRAIRSWSLLAASAVILLPGRVWADDVAQAAISDIRQENGPRTTRLIVKATAPIAYTYFSPDPRTLMVDIPGVDASKIPQLIQVGTHEVESLRVTPMSRADGRVISRLEVRLAAVVPYQIYSKDQALNLVFESPQAAAEVAPTASAAAASAPEAAAVDSAPATAPPAARAADTRVVETPAPAPSKGPAHPASKLLGVTAGGADDNVAVVVKADGSLRYQDFFLGNPDRLVLDIKDVLTGSTAKAVDVQQAPVQRLRVSQFSASAPRVVRVVVDLNRRVPYRIVEARDGLRIVFGEGQAATAAPLAALRLAEPPASSTSAAPASGAAETSALVIQPRAALRVPAAAPLPLAAASAPPSLGSDRAVGGGKTFTGHPINLDFKDGDLQDIFRLFADISGLNVVVNPGVSGKVTLKLTDVPWDQALDLILKTNGLGYTLDDNVIRIAKLSDLQKEEQERRKLQEEKELAGELVPWRHPLSYARSEDLEPTVKKVALSARGSITLDKRTNTMLITDLPANIEKAKDLVAELDRATPQVEIEARIIVTSRNFTRDIGVQWGFLNRQTPDFGTTTNRNFPNSILLNGQGIANTTGIAPNVGGVSSSEGIGANGDRGYAVNLPAAAANSALGVSLGNIIGSFNLDAAITAIERQGRGRILSTPKVTTQNNQQAEIKQGVQIPIQTVANNTVTVTFKDAVLTLKVTPQITAARTVLLQLEVENNSADFANRVNGIPPINTQSAKTNVLVSDGATTVIGGIYQSNEQTALNATPFLNKLPVLGYLFKNRLATSQNNELLLFVTPRIIKE